MHAVISDTHYGIAILIDTKGFQNNYLRWQNIISYYLERSSIHVYQNSESFNVCLKSTLKCEVDCNYIFIYMWFCVQKISLLNIKPKNIYSNSSCRNIPKLVIYIIRSNMLERGIMIYVCTSYLLIPKNCPKINSKITKFCCTLHFHKE